MKIKNKKASNLFFGLILAFVLGIVAYYVDFYFAPHKIIDNYIGQYQFSILNIHNEGEKVVLYISQAAKYSLQQAIYDLAINGGTSKAQIDETPSSEYDLSEIPDFNTCKKFYGYPVWYKLDDDGAGNYLKNACFEPKKLDINLINYFRKNINEYILSYPQSIPSEYNYEVKDSLEIIGSAARLLRLNILKDDAKRVEMIEPITNSVGMKDFTSTPLCRRGNDCSLTQQAFELLEKAREKAKDKGIELEVTEGYRTKDEQIRIWKGETSDKFNVYFPDETIRRQFVCYPYGDGVENRCPHLTGSAVDIFIKGKSKKTMTPSDYNLLFSIMSGAGWVRYTKEPWHFECCNTKRYELAKAKGLNEYGVV